MRVIHRVNLGDAVSSALPGNKDDGVLAGLPEDQGSSVREGGGKEQAA